MSDRSDIPVDELYIDRLPLPAEKRRALLAQAKRDGGDSLDVLTRVQRLLAARLTHPASDAAPDVDPAHATPMVGSPEGDAGNSSQGATVTDAHVATAAWHPHDLAEIESDSAAVLDSQPARLALAEGGSLASAAGLNEVRGVQTLRIAPPVRRASLIPREWSLNPLARLWRKLIGREDPDPLVRDAPDPKGKWSQAGRRRRWMLLSLMIARTALAPMLRLLIIPAPFLSSRRRSFHIRDEPSLSPPFIVDRSSPRPSCHAGARAYRTIRPGPRGWRRRSRVPISNAGNPARTEVELTAWHSRPFRCAARASTI